MAGKKQQLNPIPVLAMMLAWLIPGLGHVYVGRFKRGIILFLTISITFWSGIAIGGVMTADSQNERWWFFAEMFTGIHGLVSWHRQNQVYADVQKSLSKDEDFIADAGSIADVPGARARIRQIERVYEDKYLAEKNIALVPPVDTVARAYAGVAGLLNLMCVFDVVVLALMGVSGEAVPDKKRETEC